MKNFILFASFLMITGVTPTLQASEVTIMPLQWTGVAGDLVTRVSASLSLKDITALRGAGDRQSGRYEYSVQGQFQFGNRVVQVYKLSATSELSTLRKLEGTELALFTKDELVPVVFVMIGLNDSKDEFLMRDLENPPNGRKLILRAKAN